MKVVKFDDMAYLEEISMKLERVPKDKINPIIRDMKWLTTKLREAYKLLEDMADGKTET